MHILKFFVSIVFLVMVSFVYADEAKVPQALDESATSHNETEPSPEPTQQTTESQLTEKVPTGKELHVQHCQFCHARLTENKPNRLYQRPNRKVKNYMGLENQVLTCVNSLGIPWFEDEMTKVTDYLNKVFYQFDLDKTAP